MAPHAARGDRSGRRGPLPIPLRRKLALLGGTTTAGDCLVALRLLASPRALVSGGAVGTYERAFAGTTGVGHALAFASARAGLLATLEAMGVGEGDEVLLQVPTHIVVPNAIRRAGAVPVYVDCVAGNWNIDLDDAERRVTPRTRVLLLQHTFGVPVDMDAATAFAARHGLDVVEDCVHALGATWRGRPVGGLGRAAFFSTEETKMISSTMGGMVVTDDADLARRIEDARRRFAAPSRRLTRRYLLKLIAYHLLTQPTVHVLARAAYERAGQRQPLPTPTDAGELRGEWPEHLERRLSAAQATIAERQLRRLPENLRHRRALAARYAELLGERGVPPVRVPEHAEPSWVRYPLEVADRDAALRSTHRRAVLGTWFTSVLEEAASPRAGAYPAGSCPRAEQAARHLVNLPTHPRVRPDDAERIVAALPPA